LEDQQAIGMDESCSVLVISVLYRDIAEVLFVV
jgi:hypothetical protein